MMFDFNDARNNPTYLNIYKVNKIYSLPETEYIGDSWDACKTRDGNGACTDAITEGMRASTSESFRVHRIETDLKTNWAKDLDENSDNIKSKWGFFYEFQVNKLNSISKFINKKYQTLTYYGEKKENLKKFIIQNNIFGIDRVVPIGQALEIGLYWDGYDLNSSLSRIVEIK